MKELGLGNVRIINFRGVMSINYGERQESFESNSFCQLGRAIAQMRW
jgi:hypothetical protein